jgi:gas vesicle protein
MAKLSNTIATLLAGAAVGVAVGYLLATDKEKRQEDLGKIKDRLSDLKQKYAKNGAAMADSVEDIFHT